MAGQGNTPGGGDSSNRMFDLNRPQGYAKDDYLYQWRIANDTVFGIIQRSNGAQNTKDIVYAVMFSISLIAHDDIRRKEEMVFHAAMDHISRIPSSQMTQAERNDEIMRVCAITMGNLTSYVDQFRGLAHTLKVGELINFEKPYARVKNAFGDTTTPDTIEL